MIDIKADATSYILTMLLQRIEAQLPGTLDGMIEGVKADRDSVSGITSERENTLAVFEEALSLLTNAEGLSRQSHAL